MDETKDVIGEAGTASDQPADRRTPRARRGGLAVVVAGAALVALLATFGAIALVRDGAPAGTPGGANSGLGSAAGPVPKGWKVYHDPLRLFTISLPPRWTATVMMGTYTEGTTAGSMSGGSEDITFRDPAQPDGPNISVDGMQITSDFGRRLYCGAFSDRAPGSTLPVVNFNGYRATKMEPDGTVWLFESYNAHFQIDVAIPGVLVPMNPGGPLNPPPTPTAPPQSVIHADRALLATALASFRPATKPLVCH